MKDDAPKITKQESSTTASAPKIDLEFMCEIWDEKGDVLEVGPDRDGLNLIEIRFRDRDCQITDRVALTKEQARLTIKALDHVLSNPIISSEKGKAG